MTYYFWDKSGRREVLQKVQKCETSILCSGTAPSEKDFRAVPEKNVRGSHAGSLFILGGGGCYNML